MAGRLIASAYASVTGKDELKTGKSLGIIDMTTR